MKTIIVCTDFSSNATNAIQYAAALANAVKARLVLYHHFSYPVPATDLPPVFPSIFVDEMAAGFEHKLKEVKTNLAGSYPIEIDCVVRSWDFMIDLEDVFKSEKADLVVMGMHGQSAVVNALFGSMTSSAIRRGKLPLLVVPRGVVFHPVQKILFPFDDQTIEHPDTLQALRDIAHAFDSYLEVFTLFDLEKTPALVPQENRSAAKNQLDKLLKGIRHGFSYENEASVGQGILYEAARSSADMVAMIPHHHSFLSNLFQKSETQRIAAAITRPLLVLGEKILREEVVEA